MKEIKLEKKEATGNYILHDKNIIPLDDGSDIRKRNKDYYEGLKDEGVEWPVEIQGGGISDWEKKEFKVAYPVGDVFLSFTITIHELGHLRQGEIDEQFAVKQLGAPKEKREDERANSLESEKFAWDNGLKRAKKYCPEVIRELERKFKQYKE